LSGERRNKMEDILSIGYYIIIFIGALIITGLFVILILTYITLKIYKEERDDNYKK
jgi:protein-S-isoprenylcysteine O-methyltransferase Ste14